MINVKVIDEYCRLEKDDGGYIRRIPKPLREIAKKHFEDFNRHTCKIIETGKIEDPSRFFEFLWDCKAADLENIREYSKKIKSEDTENFRKYYEKYMSKIKQAFETKNPKIKIEIKGCARLYSNRSMNYEMWRTLNLVKIADLKYIREEMRNQGRDPKIRYFHDVYWNYNTPSW